MKNLTRMMIVVVPRSEENRGPFTLICAVGDGVATAGEWWEGSFCSDCGLKREMKMLFHHTYYQWC